MCMHPPTICKILLPIHLTLNIIDLYTLSLILVCLKFYHTTCMFPCNITAKVPFPLTLRFKPMLQRGVELQALDASWLVFCNSLEHILKSIYTYHIK